MIIEGVRLLDLCGTGGEKFKGCDFFPSISLKFVPRHFLCANPVLIHP